MAEHPQPEPGGSGPLKLPQGEVHVWYIPVEADAAESCQRPLEACLSLPERQKYSTLTRPAVRQNFLLSRGCLRYLLGYYLDLPPHALVFTFGPYGKPSLSSTTHQSTLQFNLSHSEQRIVIALHLQRSLGIDIEHLRPVTQLASLCRRCLTPIEAETMLPLDTEQSSRRFLQYWTAKEALLKAMGVGLTLPMDQIEVDLSLDGLTCQPLPVPVCRLQDSDDKATKESFHLYQWQPETNYLAAIAVAALRLEEPPQIMLHHINPPNLVDALFSI